MAFLFSKSLFFVFTASNTRAIDEQKIMGNKFAKLTADLLAQVKQPKRPSSRSISYGLTVNEEGKRKALSLGKFPYLSVLKAHQAVLELQTTIRS